VTWLGYFAFTYLLFMESSLGPAMPSIREDLDMGYTLASLHFTALASGAVIVAWFGDRLARRLGRARAFWAGATGVTIGAVLLVVSPHWIGTVAGALAIGMSGALLGIIVQASLADHHLEQRAVAMSEVNLAATIGAILAAAAVGLFERAGLGWRGAILTMLAAGLLVAASLRNAQFPRGLPPAAGRRRGPEHLPKLFWACCAVTTLSAGAEWGFAYWGSDFLHQEMGFSTSSAAIAMAFYFVAMGAGRLAGGVLTRRFGSYDLLIGAFAVAVIGFPIFWLTGSKVLCLIGLMLVGLGISIVYPLVASIATGLLPGRSDIAIARLLFTGSCAVLAAPFALGILGDLVGIKAAFGVIVPVLVAAFALVIGMRRTQARPRAAVA
jgi:MFS family permease